MKEPTVTRCDLDYVSQSSEYATTVKYAKQNSSIEGVSEYLPMLEREKNQYDESVKGIVEPVREVEAKKYRQWEICYKVKNISKWVFIAAMVLNILRIVLPIRMPYQLRFIDTIITSLILIASMLSPVSFVVTKIGEIILAKSYRGYVDGISGELSKKRNEFDRKVRSIYANIDDLYLNSLDPTHRELVLMRREQQAQHREMVAREQERQFIEKQRLWEEQRTRAAQERLLEIEEERERRYK